MEKMEVELDGLFRINTSYDYPDDYEYKDPAEPRGSAAVGLQVLYSLVLVVGLLGNILLLAVLAQKRRPWSMSDIFVLHLGVADILLLLTLPFWAAQAAQNCEWCSEILCRICGIVFHVNFYCGIFLLVCISLDHYLSAIHAIQLYSRWGPRSVHISCLAVWIISLLLTIPDWMYLGHKKDPAPCVRSYSDLSLLSHMFHHTIGFVLPGAVLIICCAHILVRLLSNPRSLPKQRAVMILSLVAVFFLFWFPYNIILFLDTVRKSSAKKDTSPTGKLETALMATAALGCIHSCLRPLLYLGLCKGFRKQLLATLRRATVDSNSPLWELGVGEEAVREQNQELEEQKQMSSGC
ncbi:C-X-C chemokine receptor type 3-like [Parambassis ranga]|uniref:C-X-C chemokine receptor type 3-like n=1 Tax=Parambassis ranga TaxID=210632 RepID=A0A6P7JZG3_9TELE|nr:C-X-C chemokine receptor type 3-like [Parambassis ranga]